MRNDRTRFAGMLAIGATILLISILIGTRLGDRVIVGADGKSIDVAVDLPTPVPVSSASVPQASGKWKKSQVVSVATDPAFPDPRVTPTPEPTPTPQPKATPQRKGQPPNAKATAHVPLTSTILDGSHAVTPAPEPLPSAYAEAFPILRLRMNWASKRRVGCRWIPA